MHHVNAYQRGAALGLEHSLYDPAKACLRKYDVTNQQHNDDYATKDHFI